MLLVVEGDNRGTHTREERDVQEAIENPVAARADEETTALVRSLIRKSSVCGE